MVNISYVGGCMVRITILPLAAHCLRYSTRKKVSKMSMPSVGWGRRRWRMMIRRWERK